MGRPNLSALGALLLLLSAPTSARAAAPCEQVRALPAWEALPVAWQQALDELVDATARQGQPWSCPGGSVALELGAVGATLVVHDRRARAVRRPVAEPSDVVPVGKALLAAPSLALALEPLPPSPPAVPPPDALPPPPAVVVAPLPVPAREPRLLLNGLVGSRISGPGTTGWASLRIAAAVPLDAWSIGLWARYELPFTVSGPLPSEFSMDAADVGLSASRRLVSWPSFELRATLDPALSLVMMESGDENVEDHPEGASVGFRLGGGVDLIWKAGKVLRGLLRFDAEVTPAGLGGPIRIAPGLPVVPVYMAGVSLGLEAVIP